MARTVANMSAGSDISSAISLSTASRKESIDGRILGAISWDLKMEE